jgi:hypothetical protein
MFSAFIMKKICVRTRFYINDYSIIDEEENTQHIYII